MPLIKKKSEKAFKHNLKAEMHAGKPQKQAIAIAYSVKRQAQHKAKGGEMKISPKKNARMVESDLIKAKRIQEREELFEGGAVGEKASEMDREPNESPLNPIHDEEAPSEQEIMSSHMAEGGIVDEDVLDHAASIASAIMAKRHAKRMAEGGAVDINENAEEEPNAFYHQNEDVALKENYDSDMDGVSQPMDSNEMGDSREMDEENEHDASIASKIRSKMKKRSPIVK